MKSRIARLVPACLLVLSAGALTACGPEDDESEASGRTAPSSQAAGGEDVSPSAAPEPAAETSAPASEEPTSEETDEGALLKDAYAGKLTIRCTFEQEGNKGTAYIKSDAHLRMDMNTPQGEMHFLKLDRTTYMWGGNLPQGMKFDGQALNDSFDAQFDQFTPEEFEEHAEGNNIRCAEHSGDDSMFAVPAGVSFNTLG